MHWRFEIRFEACRSYHDHRSIKWRGYFLAVHVPIDSRCGQAMVDNVEFCLCLYDNG